MSDIELWVQLIVKVTKLNQNSNGLERPTLKSHMQLKSHHLTYCVNIKH